jgi:iron complex transport system permease protein
MMNAFCAAVIMFLISMTRSFQVQHILYWLMGDLATMQKEQMPILLLVLPCFVIIFILARPMNLLLLGRETAAAMGINVKNIVLLLLVITSLMVSIIVSLSGLVGFVGLVIPHIFRLVLGPDHRLLVPSCLLGGATYLILCDLLARVLPSSGELPVGIITALIGAPLFIVLLLRNRA